MELSQVVLSAILRDAGVALLLVDSTGRVQYANVAALAQVNRGDLHGIGVVELFAVADRAAVAAFVDSLDEIGDAGRVRELGPIALARPGSRVVMVTGAALRGLPGSTGAVLSLFDVTDLVDRGDVVADMRELRTEAELARHEARTDPGTGLPNRRQLDEDLPAVQESAAAAGSPVGVVFIDLDRFGLLNKHRGDDAGDAALAVVAAVLAGQSRAGDRFYRKGGEEFVGLLQDTDMRAALRVAERLRAAVEAASIPHGGHPGCPTLTVSVGVAADLVDHRSVDRLVVVAGREMLRAKRSGRNQVSPRPDLRPHRRGRPEPDSDDAA